MRTHGFILLLLLAACSGGTVVGSSSSGSGGGSGSGSGNGNGSGNGSGSSGAGGGAMVPDAGADALPPEGGAPDPGSVLCNGLPCASVDHYCCDDPAQPPEKCVPDFVSACGGLRRQCDEAADCPGKVCCIPPNQAPFIAYNTMCAPTCAGDPLVYQVCKTDAECENKQPCVTQLCHGEVIQSCGPLPVNRCQ